MSDFEKAVKCPSCVYNEPQEVLDDSSINQYQRKQIITQWEKNALQFFHADDENMKIVYPSLLNRL